MPVTYRRLYGWTGTKWIEVRVDEDGNLIASSETTATVGGIALQRVFDVNVNEVLDDILSELNLMNLHLQSMTDEEFNNGN